MLTEIMASISEFLTRDLRHEILSVSAEQKRRHYVDIIQSFKHDDQRYIAAATATERAGNTHSSN